MADHSTTATESGSGSPALPPHRSIGHLRGRAAMVSSLVVETRRWPATARGWPLALLILIFALLVGFSTAIAAEKKGFVILPNKAPHFGPIGDETTTADILATHEQTGGSFACGVTRATIAAA